MLKFTFFLNSAPSSITSTVVKNCRIVHVQLLMQKCMYITYPCNYHDPMHDQNSIEIRKHFPLISIGFGLGGYESKFCVHNSEGLHTSKSYKLFFLNIMMESLAKFSKTSPHESHWRVLPFSIIAFHMPAD